MDYAKSLHPSPCHFPLETLINTGDSEGKMNGEGFLRISIFFKQHVDSRCLIALRLRNRPYPELR